MKKNKKQNYKWLVWDIDSEFPFGYKTRKEAEKDLRIFNNERCDWEEKFYLFKIIK